MNQGPVKYVEPNFLLTEEDKLRYSSKRRQRDMIPVIKLEDLREVVEGLASLPHKEGCAVFKDLLDGGGGECSCPKRLLAGLGEVGE